MPLVAGDREGQRVPVRERQVCDGNDELMFETGAIEIEPAHDSACVAAIMYRRDPAPFPPFELRALLLDVRGEIGCRHGVERQSGFELCYEPFDLRLIVDHRDPVCESSL